MILNDYLKETKEKIIDKKYHKYTIVIGNESGDLDSIMSSLCYAFILNAKDKDNVYIPIININKDELKLRTEIVWIFKEIGLNIDYLWFTSCSEVMDFLKNHLTKINVVLVDHNKITNNFSFLQEKVVQIVDHHLDENYHTQSKRIIKTVGSCATLIAKEFKDLIDYNNDQLDFDTNVCLSNLLLAPILIDTINLDKSIDRVTNDDLESTRFLLKINKGVIKLNHTTEFESTHAYYNKLEEKRNDITLLSIHEIMIKDYKEYLIDINCKKPFSLGISAISNYSFESIFKDHTLLKLLKESKKLINNNKLQILLLMTNYKNKNEAFNRELAFLSLNKEFYDKFINMIRNSDLKLSPINYNLVDYDMEFSFYHQNNISFSRKKLYPMLLELIKRCKPFL